MWNSGLFTFSSQVSLVELHFRSASISTEPLQLSGVCWPTSSLAGHSVQKYLSGNLIFGCVVWDTRGLAWTLQPAGMLVSHTLGTRHQVTQQSNPGHPPETCLPLRENNGRILGWQRVRGAPAEEAHTLVAVNLLLNLKAIDPVCLFSLTGDVLLEDLSGSPLYWLNGQNGAQCEETTANQSPGEDAIPLTSTRPLGDNCLHASSTFQRTCSVSRKLRQSSGFGTK